MLGADGDDPTASGPAGAGTWPARLGRVFDALDVAGVRWSLLRPVSALGSTAGDIDLLTLPEHLPRVRQVLMEQGFVPLPLGDTTRLHVADYDPESDRLLWLDVQVELELAGQLIPAITVLDHLATAPLPHPADDWMVWILLLRAVFSERGLASRYHEITRRLARDARPGAPELRQVATARGLDPDALLDLGARGAWVELRDVSRTSDRPRGARRRLAERRAWLLGLWTRRGISVAVIGPDGAGKTTLVSTVSRSLPFPTRVVYMGLTGGRLPLADRLRVPGLVFAARIGLLWARYASALWHRARGRIVLYDRHPLDAEVPAGREMSPLASFSRRVQGRAVPTPQLVILLDASGTTMHRRKGEYDADRLEAWRRRYQQLSDRVPVLQVLDAERPAEAVRRDAVSLIWNQYRLRWSR